MSTSLDPGQAQHYVRPGLKVIKLFSCSTQLSTKFIMLINVKMPTIVGILTFISMINTTSESLKASKVFIFSHFIFYEQLKFHAQLSWARKKFYNLGAWSGSELFTVVNVHSKIFALVNFCKVWWKQKPLQNGEITLSLNDVGKSCPSLEFSVTNMSFYAIAILMREKMFTFRINS